MNTKDLQNGLTEEVYIFHPITEAEQVKICFENFKPDPDSVEPCVFESTYKEAEEWGAMPVSHDELIENIGHKEN